MIIKCFNDCFKIGKEIKFILNRRKFDERCIFIAIFIVFLIFFYLALFYFNVTKNMIGEQELDLKKFLKMQLKQKVFLKLFVLL